MTNSTSSKRRAPHNLQSHGATLLTAATKKRDATQTHAPTIRQSTLYTNCGGGLHTPRRQSGHFQHSRALAKFMMSPASGKHRHAAGIIPKTKTKHVVLVPRNAHRPAVTDCNTFCRTWLVLAPSLAKSRNFCSTIHPTAVHLSPPLHQTSELYYNVFV